MERLTTRPTRRAILTAAVAAPALVAIGNTAAASAPFAPADSAWTRLVAALDRATLAQQALATEHDAATDAYMSGRKLIGAKPTAPANEYPKQIAEMTIAELRAPATPSAVAQKRYDSDLAAWVAAERDLDQRTGMTAINDRWEAALIVQENAASAVFAYPAPNADALLYKLDAASSRYEGFDLDQTVQAQIFADVRRLLTGEASA